MIELIKKEIHMNRQRGTAVSQLTLDDDFIVPDALDDAVQILLSDGEVQIENSRIQGEKVLIRGKLVFRVLYRRESGGLQAMGGEIPFEETVNVPELSERDYTQIVWNIEDLNITMIHSRKLSAKADAYGAGGKPRRCAGCRGRRDGRCGAASPEEKRSGSDACSAAQRYLPGPGGSKRIGK